MAVEFEFVAQEPNSQGFTRETRTKIRRQAMKAAGEARRRRGNYGQQNLRQYPVFLDDEEDREQEPLPVSTDLSPSLQVNERLGTPMSSTGLDTVIVQCGVHVLDLSALTVVHIGQVAAALLTQQPSLLGGVLGCPQWSYFSYLSCRYGSSPCLDDALYCLLFTARETLRSGNKSSGFNVLRQYGKALRSLQTAVEDPKSWSEPEVLCATGILALFEILNPSSAYAWSNYLQGASRLIRLRGPAMYETDFEKALLIGLSGPLICQALFDNEACFLEQELWQRVLDSFIDQNCVVTERSTLWISLLKLLAVMPGIFAEITNIVCQEKSLSQSAQARAIQTVRQFRKDLIQWSSTYCSYILTQGARQQRHRPDDKLVELLGTSLLLRIIASRLLGAISTAERAVLEDEALCLAKEVTTLEKDMSSVNRRASFYLAQKARVANATLQTSGLWEDTDIASTEGKLIEKWKFERWCSLIPRKTSTKKVNCSLLR